MILNQRTKFSLSHHIIVWIILVCLSATSYAVYKTVESIEFQKNIPIQTTNQPQSVNSSPNRSSKKIHKKPSRTDNTKKTSVSKSQAKKL